MTNKTKIALAAALVASLATPAVAQAQDYIGYRVKHQRLLEGRNSAVTFDSGALTGGTTGREALVRATN
jgi:hypothetical protein